MKGSFILFFGLVFAVYFSIQGILFILGWRALGWKKRWRGWYAVVFWSLALSFLAGRYLESLAVTPFATALLWIGAFWLAVMYYLFLGSLVLGVTLFIIRRLPFVPAGHRTPSERTRFRNALILLIFVLGLVAWGHWNAKHPQISTIEIKLPHKNGDQRDVRLVVASDLHLGTLVTRAGVADWVKTINALKPDAIILVGDVVDGDVAPVIELDLGGVLRELRAPMGVYAVTGNHEYIGGVERAVAYLEKNGIRFLRDQSVSLGGGTLWLAGREDVSIRRFRGVERAPLSEVLRVVPSGASVIVADHQPSSLQEAAREGAVLQLSGHTHDGQLWPNKYIVRSIFGLDSGRGMLEGMPFYVSTGLGTWGPPVRVGNHPEILVVDVKMDGEKK